MPSIPIIPTNRIVAETQLPKRQRRFAGRSATVGIAPDAVDLARCQPSPSSIRLSALSSLPPPASARTGLGNQ